MSAALIRRCLNQKRVDLAIQKPKLDVVTINKLLGELNSLVVVLAMEIDTTFHVAVRPKDKGSITLHNRCAALENGDGLMPSRQTWQPLPVLIVQQIFQSRWGPQSR